MKNMKVKQKLLISFLVIAIITAIVGGVGIAGLIQLNENEHTIYELGIKISDVNRLIENIQKQRSAYRDVVLYANSEQKRMGAVALSEELETEFRAMHANLVEILATETSHRLLRDIMDIYENKFDPIKQQVMQPEVAQDEELHYHLMELLAVELNALMEKLDELINYAIAYTEDVSETDSRTANRMILIVAALAVISVAGAIFMGLYLAQQITVPLLKMKAVIDRVGNTGCLEFSDEEMGGLVEESKGQDEICQSIASSVKMIRHLMNASIALGQVTDGDLTAEFHTLSENDTIGVALNRMLYQLNTMLSEVHISSSQVSSGSEQVSHGAQELASGSSQQAASIEEFTATLQELRSKTDHNAENATQAREANGRASDRLEGSINSMRELLIAMKAIDESSNNITKVIKVIDDIAFQTNILALNAAVEAARAGQHGKGFAVVADEVRNLAAKSAEAAKETAELIDGSSARVKEGNQIVEKTNSDLEAAVQNSREITRLIEQVAAESNDQANALAEINQGIEQISSVVQSNSATSEQSAAASEQMSAQAANLEEIVSRFKLREQAAQRAGYAMQEDSFGDSASADTGFALSWKRRTSA